MKNRKLLPLSQATPACHRRLPSHTLLTTESSLPVLQDSLIYRMLPRHVTNRSHLSQAHPTCQGHSSSSHYPKILSSYYMLLLLVPNFHHLSLLPSTCHKLFPPVASSSYQPEAPPTIYQLPQLLQGPSTYRKLLPPVTSPSYISQAPPTSYKLLPATANPSHLSKTPNSHITKPTTYMYPMVVLHQLPGDVLEGTKVTVAAAAAVPGRYNVGVRLPLPVGNLSIGGARGSVGHPSCGHNTH